MIGVPGGFDLLLACGFVEDGDILTLPSHVQSLEAAHEQLKDSSSEAVMKQKRIERDAKIKEEKERSAKNYLPSKARMGSEMQKTIDLIRDDQAMLDEFRKPQNRDVAQCDPDFPLTY